MRNLLALAPLTLLSSLALAGGAEWDWDEEFSSRHWRTATLQWAHDIHPNHPSFANLQENFYPPAEQMWCHFEEEPKQEDFQIHGQLLADWLHDFLEIPYNQPLPSNLPMFPSEC